MQGGSILHGPVNVPGQGGVLIVAEPTGAITGFSQPEPGYEFASIARHVRVGRAADCGRQGG